MPEVANLQVVVGADTSDAESALSGFGSKMSGLLATGAVAAGAAVAAGLAVGVKSAGDLEQAVANISTIKPDIDTSAVFASLNEMSTRVPQSSKQLGDALYNVFSSIDVSTEQAMGLVETFAKGAVGAQTDAETFGTSILGVLNAYGIAAEDAGHVSDVFFNTVNKGVITGQELASSLGPVTQSAKAAGVSLDELGAMVAAVTKEGGPAAQNVNNLNNFLQKITTKEAQKQLNDLGVATTDATGAFRPTADVLTDLKGKLGNMTEAARANALQAIFPDAQARIGAATLLSQLDLVKSATDENRNNAGAAAAAYEKMSATFNSQSQLLMNSLMAMLTTVGAAVLPAITPLVKAFADTLPAAFQTATNVFRDMRAVFLGDDEGNAFTLDKIFPPGVTDAITAIVAGLGVLTRAVQDFAAVLTGEWDESTTTAYESLSQLFGQDAVNLALEWVKDIMGAVKAVAGFIVQQFGVVASWFQANMPLILKTVQVVLTAIGDFWKAHGDLIITVVQAAWTIISTVIGNSIKMVLDIIKLGMQVITGDWQGAWATVLDIVSLQWDTISTVIGAALSVIGALIDDQTGGMLTATVTWLKDTWAAISTAWTDITTAIGDAWNAIETVTTTVMRAVQNVITAVWTAIYDNVIQPKLDAIGTLISTVWDAIQTKTSEIFGPLLTYLRDTIWEPIRSAIETAINAARDIFGQALDAISNKAHAILDPILAWWRDTIWEPLRAFVDNALYGPKGVHTQFESAITGISNIITGPLQAIKSAWETVWGAIQAAAESPQKAMETIIDLVNKLKSIMPDWLIPHSPTPFQVGLEGIMKAAKDMDGAFRGMGGAVSGAVDDWLRAAMKLAGVSEDWLPGLARLVGWESTGNPHAVNPQTVNGQHATGLMQTLPSTFRAYALPGMDDILNPIHNAAAAIRYIKDTYGSVYEIPGIRSGNHGAFPGYAGGGWAGLHGPEMAMLGERGPEYVIPHNALGAAGSTYIDLRGAQVYDGSKFEDLLVGALDRANRRGRLVKVTA